MKKLIVLIMAIVILSSCFNFKKEEKQGSGNVISQKMEASLFDAISVSDGLKVYVTMGEKESIEVQADDNLMEYIKAEVNSGTLQIYVNENVNLKMNNVRVNVTAVELTKLNASSGSNLTVENMIKSELFNCEASSGADMEFQIMTENLSVNASSSGEITIKGKADEASLSASSAGDIEANNLRVSDCDADASSGSEINVYVSGDLSASASSGGEINFKGNPNIKKMNSSSGGEINKE